MGRMAPASESKRPPGRRAASRSDHDGPISSGVPEMSQRISNLEHEVLRKGEKIEELERELGEQRRRRQHDRKRVLELEEETDLVKKENSRMGATIEALETQVQELGGKMRSREDKKITGKTVLYERAHELEEHVENMYDKKDLPCLFLKVLKWLSDCTIDLRMKLREYNEFKPILAVIHAERDASSAKYLRENVYNDEAFGLLLEAVRQPVKEGVRSGTAVLQVPSRCAESAAAHQDEQRQRHTSA